jgi:hypothetical protein
MQRLLSTTYGTCVFELVIAIDKEAWKLETVFHRGWFDQIE